MMGRILLAMLVLAATSLPAAAATAKGQSPLGEDMSPEWHLASAKVQVLGEAGLALDTTAATLLSHPDLAALLWEVASETGILSGEVSVDPTGKPEVRWQAPSLSPAVRQHFLPHVAAVILADAPESANFLELATSERPGDGFQFFRINKHVVPQMMLAMRKGVRTFDPNDPEQYKQLNTMALAPAAVDAKPGREDADRPPAIDTPPRVLREPIVPYPSDLMATKPEGTVVLRFMVSKEGNLSTPLNEVSVIASPHPRLAEALIRALPDFIFSPATSRDQPIEATMTLKYDFYVQDLGIDFLFEE